MPLSTATFTSLGLAACAPDGAPPPLLELRFADLARAWCELVDVAAVDDPIIAVIAIVIGGAALVCLVRLGVTSWLTDRADARRFWPSGQAIGALRADRSIHALAELPGVLEGWGLFCP